MRDTIDLIREAGIDEWWSSGGEVRETFDEYLKAFEALVRADERWELEQQLLKLRQGVAANSDYIQGRWDLIGELQDIIRNRGNT